MSRQVKESILPTPTAHDMTSRESDCWSCHPDLEHEWKQFINDCQTSAKSDLRSDLWMNFWCTVLPATTSENVQTGSLQDSVEPSVSSSRHEANMSPMASTVACVQENVESQGKGAPLTDSQLKQISSINEELLDILDMACENIPDELKEDIRSLPLQGMIVLLKDLESKLTDEGAYNFCTLICEEVDRKPWINVALVFEILFLPMLHGDSNNSIAEEVKAGLLQITERFPSECVSHLMKPLLASKLKSPSHLELLSGLTPLFPDKDFMSLLRYFVEQCDAPIKEWRISVLNNFLSKVRPGILEKKVDSPLLDLLPVLSASARSLSASESFASLLLKVIPVLKWNNSPRLHNELMIIVQQNNSYNKQALMNAIKNLRA